MKQQSVFFLSSAESDAIKGILILLIIAAHNTLLVETSSDLQHFVYFFHVSIFFILPLFYSKTREYDWTDCLNILIRSWVPYAVFFVFSFIIYHAFFCQQMPKMSVVLSAFFYATQGQLKEVAGFHFLWFMPAFAVFSLCRVAYLSRFTVFRFVIPALALFFLAAVNLGLPGAGFAILPLGIPAGMFYFGLGFSTPLIFQIPLSDKQRKISGLIFAPCAFLVLAFLFFRYQVEFLFRWALPIVVFAFLYSLRENLGKMTWLQTIGRCSLGMYFVHVYFYNIYLLVLKSFLPLSMTTGWLIFLLTAISAFGTMYLADRYFPFLLRLVFPRGIKKPQA